MKFANLQMAASSQFSVLFSKLTLLHKDNSIRLPISMQVFTPKAALGTVRIMETLPGTCPRKLRPKTGCKTVNFEKRTENLLRAAMYCFYYYYYLNTFIAPNLVKV
jgi:hypothetical protein